MPTTFWLRADETTMTQWAAFTTCANAQMDVLALVGIEPVFNRRLWKTDAMIAWRRLVRAGWHMADDAEVAEADMSLRRLRLTAYGE